MTPIYEASNAEKERWSGVGGSTDGLLWRVVLGLAGRCTAVGGGLTREDGLVELVHDAVAVGPFVVQGLRAAEEAGGTEVNLLGLALLAPDEAQLRFRGTNAWVKPCVVRGTTLVRRGQSRGYICTEPPS